ncbi:hypothetical protein B484DRAFT_410897, partial [Ochromonadaceae sp. CCMP2298]
AVGVGSYIGVSYTERSSALSQFQSTVDAAVTKLDDNFYKMDTGLRLMAQAYVELHPTLADWPNAVLPNFQTSAMLANEIGGCDRVGLAVNVKPEHDLPSYEAFMINNWDNDPAIPTGSAGVYSLAPFKRGLWGVNDSASGIRASFLTPHHETTGWTTWGDSKRIFPLAQLLFTKNTPAAPDALGYNMYSTENEGEAIDRLVGCVDDSSFTGATLHCGATSKMTGSSDSADYLERTDYALSSVTSFRTVSIVVGTDTHHELVGSVGGQYNWGPTLSRIFADDVSGIDIVYAYSD